MAPSRLTLPRMRTAVTALMLASLPASALAQAPAPSESAMVNLVRLLVAQGVITKDKGDALLAQAEAEAQTARATQATQQAAASGEQPLPAAAAGSIRVPYVPETVRAQIRDELKDAVFAQAKSEGWARAGEAAPEWTKRITLSGDLRVRSQSSLYSKSNSNLIPDFARFNATGPSALFLSTFLPTLNTTEDRTNRLTIRARLNVGVNLAKDLQLGLQLATGDNNSPISTNANLGGGFAKRDIWLQQAYLRAGMMDNLIVAKAGRMPNPFFSSDLHFDDDLAFDGLAVEFNAGRLIGDKVKLSLRGGAFPLDFGDPNLPAFQVAKKSSPERWLLAAQIEAGAQFTDDITARIGAGYYHYTKMRAHLSDVCTPYSVVSDARRFVFCSTDNEVANFLTKGNTVFPIRNLDLNTPPPATGEVRTDPQLVGLLFNYHILDVNGEVKFRVNDDIGATVRGNYVRNLAFKRRNICSLGANAAFPPLNNVVTTVATATGNVCDGTAGNTFSGGNEGYLASITVGHDTLDRWGQWRVMGGYRYLQSDAVLDAFTDSDFHLGGTNAKGWFVGAWAGITNGVNIGARWMSANEITGEPFAVDVLQIDLNARF